MKLNMDFIPDEIKNVKIKFGEQELVANMTFNRGIFIVNITDEMPTESCLKIIYGLGEIFNYVQDGETKYFKVVSEPEFDYTTGNKCPIFFRAEGVKPRIVYDNERNARRNS